MQARCNLPCLYPLSARKDDAIQLISSRQAKGQPQTVQGTHVAASFRSVSGLTTMGVPVITSLTFLPSAAVCQQCLHLLETLPRLISCLEYHPVMLCDLARLV